MQNAGISLIDQSFSKIERFLLRNNLAILYVLWYNTYTYTSDLRHVGLAFQNDLPLAGAFASLMPMILK